MSKGEILIYNYYFTLLSLLKIGIPYNTFEQMSEEHVAYVLGIEGALAQIRWDNSQNG